MVPRLSIFTPGPRGKLYVHPDYAADLFRILEVQSGYAVSGLRRAKETFANTGEESCRGQIAHWKSVLMVLTLLEKTLHRGIDPDDYDAAGPGVQDLTELFQILSPYCRAQRKAEGESAN